MNSFAIQARLFAIMARTKDFDEKEVLAKAVQVFWLKGYNGTSMQDLVDGLGISRSSLYDTYTDKHTLFLKALDTYQQSATARVDEIIQTTASAKDTIRKLLELVSNDLVCDSQQKGCFLVNAGVEVAAVDKEVGAMICRNDQYMETSFFDVIQKGQQSGEITNKQDALALARFVFNTVKGLRVTAKSTTNKATFDDIINLTVSVLG